MKKLIFSFFATFFILIFIWFIMGYIRFGDDLFSKHFDLKSTISNLTDIFKFDINDLLDTIESFGDIAKLDEKGDATFFDYIGSFFDTIILKPINLGINILNLIIDFVIAIIKFIFVPSFI